MSNYELSKLFYLAESKIDVENEDKDKNDYDYWVLSSSEDWLNSSLKEELDERSDFAKLKKIFIDWYRYDDDLSDKNKIKNCLNKWIREQGNLEWIKKQGNLYYRKKQIYSEWIKRKEYLKNYSDKFLDSAKEEICTFIANFAEAKKLMQAHIDAVGASTLNMNKLQELLFPVKFKPKDDTNNDDNTKDYHVFLSHYHVEANSLRAKKIQTIKYALAKKGLRVFTDDEHWGSADQTIELLLNMLPSPHTVRQGNRGYTYNFHTALKVISAVYMALQMAITQQMLACRNFLFLDRRHDINNDFRNKIQVYSPWLYHEVYSAPSLLAYTSKQIRQYPMPMENFQEQKSPAVKPAYIITNWEDEAKAGHAVYIWNIQDLVSKVN